VPASVKSRVALARIVLGFVSDMVGSFSLTLPRRS
jgi:hypothetical protein